MSAETKCSQSVFRDRQAAVSFAEPCRRKASVFMFAYQCEEQHWHVRGVA